MDPKTLLPILLGVAVGAGGIFQGLSWRSTRSATDLADLETQLQLATEENALLQRENESLRSLAQGGGSLAVPQLLIDRVEREYELRFLSNPVVHKIASEELRDRISAAYESRLGPEGIDHRQEAYTYIGWLRPDDQLLPQLTAVRSVGARGWFDDVTGESWVTDRFDVKNVPDQAALMRLLARTLLNQHFPPTPAYPGDDAARAREALHQGTASGSEARFYAANARSIGFMPMKENAEAEQLLSALSPFIQGITVFPVVEGKGFSDTLYVQGTDKLMDAFRNPPQTTRSILLPGSPVEAPPALELPKVSDEPFLTETAGELGLRLWLEPLGDVGAASEIASSWKNDRYVLFPEGETGSALIWEIQLDSTEAVDQLQSIALDLIAAMSGKEESAELGKISVTLEGRQLLISRPAPDRLRFVNAGEAATADRFK